MSLLSATRLNFRAWSKSSSHLLRSRLFPWLSVAAVLIGLTIILYLAWDLRTEGMRSPSEALLFIDDYDEGVNVSAAQLLLQGALPYRDYFFAHPPLGILVLAGILRFHFVPWGDTLTFVLARYASMAFGIATVVLVFAVASRLGGWPSGLVAAGTLALDILVIQVDRQAMLEPLMNLVSALAILLFLLALDRDRSRRGWMAAAGAAGASAALVRTTGAMTLGAILIYSLLRLLSASRSESKQKEKPSRDALKVRAVDLLFLIGGAVAAALLITGWFLIQAPTDFLRQVYVFQLFRPPDGMQDAGTRLSTILADDDAHLSIYLGLAGTALLIIRGALSRRLGQWGLILLWTGLIVLLFVSARTYFFHYYTQLAVPLAILAGALVSRAPISLRTRSDGGRVPADSTMKSANRRDHLGGRALLVAQALLVVYMLATNLEPAQLQYKQARDLAKDRQATLANIARFLTSKTLPASKVLTFVPALPIVASRPIVATAGRYSIDTYGYMQYLTLGLDQDWMPDSTSIGVMDALRGDDAQDWVKELASQADYVVMDDRGRWQLKPETVLAVRAGRHPTYGADNITIWAR